MARRKRFFITAQRTSGRAIFFKKPFATRQLATKALAESRRRAKEKEKQIISSGRTVIKAPFKNIRIKRV